MARNESPEVAAAAQENVEGGASSQVKTMVKEAEANVEATKRSELEATFDRTLKGMLENAEFKSDLDRDAWETTMDMAKDLVVNEVMGQDDPHQKLVELVLDNKRVEGLIETAADAEEKDEAIKAEWKQAVNTAKKMDQMYDAGKDLFHLLSETEAFARVKDLEAKTEKLKDRLIADAFLKAEKNGTEAADELYELMGNEAYIVETAEDMFLEQEMAETEDEIKVQEAREVAEAQAAVENAAGAETEIGASGMQELKKQFEVVANTPDIDFTWDQLVAAPAKPTGFFGKVGTFLSRVPLIGGLFGGKSPRDKMIEAVNNAYYQYEVSGATEVKPIGAAYKQEDAGSKTKSELGQ
ncbi:MAG: hypothetical protein V1695_01540 [Candidatus Uhrbacteria bacterium]